MKKGPKPSDEMFVSVCKKDRSTNTKPPDDQEAIIIIDRKKAVKDGPNQITIKTPKYETENLCHLAFPATFLLPRCDRTQTGLTVGLVFRYKSDVKEAVERRASCGWKGRCATNVRGLVSCGTHPAPVSSRRSRARPSEYYNVTIEFQRNGILRPNLSTG